MLDLRYAEWLPNRFGGSESKWTMEYEGKTLHGEISRPQSFAKADNIELH